MAATVVGTAAGGAGGPIGVLLSQYIEDRYARRVQEQLGHSGLLLWVRTTGREHEDRAMTILKRNGAEDVHVQELTDISYQLEGGVSHNTSFMRRLGL